MLNAVGAQKTGRKYIFVDAIVEQKKRLGLEILGMVTHKVADASQQKKLLREAEKDFLYMAVAEQGFIVFGLTCGQGAHGIRP